MTGKKCPTEHLAVAETCPGGEYSNTTGQLTCVTCTEGYQCLDKTTAPVICPAGTYSAAGSISCTSCPSGQCQMLPIICYLCPGVTV